MLKTISPRGKLVASHSSGGTVTNTYVTESREVFTYSGVISGGIWCPRGLEIHMKLTPLNPGETELISWDDYGVPLDDSWRPAGIPASELTRLDGVGYRLSEPESTVGRYGVSSSAAKAITARVTGTRRVGTTSIGNPTYAVTLEISAIEGMPTNAPVTLELRTAPNAGIAYSITNSELRDFPHNFQLSPRSQIQSVTRAR